MNQAGPLIILSDTDTQDRDSQPGSNVNPDLSLEGSDLSDYLHDCVEIDDIDTLLVDSPNEDSSFSAASASVVVISTST